MESRPIPPEVHVLLREHVCTFEEIEILLLLLGDPRKPWSADAIVGALRLDWQTAIEALEALSRGGLIAERAGPDPAFVYRPGNAGREAAIAWLAGCWKEGGVEIARILNANAIDRVRRSALRTFADAFLLWRKERS